MTYKLSSVKSIQTVFVGNSEMELALRINPSRITIGNSSDPQLNPVCFNDITDGGWYECPTPMLGEYISIHKTDGTSSEYNIWTLRAYEGINIAKSAVVAYEPDHDEEQTATNLLMQYPRTLRQTRNAYYIPGSTAIL